MSEMYIGYISSSRIDGSVIPQRVQNLVIRDFAKKKGLVFALSATEYNIEGSSMILRSLIEQDVSGVMFYSLWQLDGKIHQLISIYRDFLKHDKTILFALENMIIESEEEIKDLEELMLIKKNAPTYDFKNDSL